MRFADHLSEEIARLEAELEALPTYQMLKALKAAAAVAPKVYGPPSPPSPSAQASADRHAEGDEHRRSASGRRLDPARQQALEVAIALLTGRSEPTKTADVYEYIVARGITLGGSDPQNNLSSLLNRSGFFDSHGRRGWTLKSEASRTSSEPDEEWLQVEEDEPDEALASHADQRSDSEQEVEPANRSHFSWEGTPP